MIQTHTESKREKLQQNIDWSAASIEKFRPEWRECAHVRTVCVLVCWYSVSVYDRARILYFVLPAIAMLFAICCFGTIGMRFIPSIVMYSYSYIKYVWIWPYFDGAITSKISLLSSFLLFFAACSCIWFSIWTIGKLHTCAEFSSNRWTTDNGEEEKTKLLNDQR